MPTTQLTVFDLLRVTYTYEAKALEARYGTKSCSNPEMCASLSHTNTSTSSQGALETDYTQRFIKSNWRRDSVVT